MKKKRLMALLIALVMVMMLMFTSCKSQAERDLEDAQRAAEAADQQYQQAVTNAERTDALIAEYYELQDLISTLPDGPERDWAIQRNNQIVMELIDEYPELAQYVY